MWLDAGENTIIKDAIVDSNAAVGRNVKIVNAAGVTEADQSQSGYVIQDGITVILKGAVIPDDTRIWEDQERTFGIWTEN